MSGPRIGSLFTGSAQLDCAVQQVFGGDIAWQSEIEPAAVRLLHHRYPTVTNLGDITTIDWTRIEPIDILVGGFPCQDVSTAGLRAGIKPGTRSGLWAKMANAIRVLRPRLVIIENVKGLLYAPAHRDVEPDEATLGDGSGEPLRAAGAVCGDLADLFYDTVGKVVSASSVGACHQRDRVFLIAVDTRRANPPPPDTHTGTALTDAVHAVHDEGVPTWLLPSPFTRDYKGPYPRADKGECLPGAIEELMATLNAPDRQQALLPDGEHDPWGRYGPAVRRWERILKRAAPQPTEPNTIGGRRLSPLFSEWMMGLPKGWVTDLPITRPDKLKIIGNGCVDLQVQSAVRQILRIIEMSL